MSQQIGRFVVRRLLGRGTQSAVYLAWDPHLEREVAIKTMHFARPDPGHNALLLQEARTVSKLRHGNVVPIFEAGEQDGDPYLVFEYVEGGTLSEVLARDGAMPALRAVDVVAQILDAVAAAHKVGIVHRDLKPSNVLMSEEGVPRVMDFGIASRLDDGPAANQRLMGTPAYMSPEYITARTVGPQSDVFAAGLILFELLFGRRAVAGESALEVMNRISSGPIDIPADGLVRIDENLRAILLKATAPDPALRYESAQMFREALTDYLKPPPAAQEQAEVGQATSGTLEFLLRRMRHKSDFPALSEAISTINRLASSENQNTGTLASSILKDFALTNKLLRMVNSAYYRQAGGGNISTVSRAIVVMGFNAVRSIAVSLILFEHLQDKGNAALLKEEFLRANVSGMLARELAGKLMPREAEESFICSMFHGLGRLLTQYYFPEEAEAIRRLIEQQGVSEQTAATRVLGLGYEQLGLAIARSWGFPEDIQHSMKRVPPGLVRAPANKPERLRVLAGFSNELCMAAEAEDAPGRSQALVRLRQRYGEAMPVKDTVIEEALDKAFSQAADFCAVVHLNLRQTRLGRRMEQVLHHTDEGAANAAESSLAGVTGTLLGEAAAPPRAGDAPAEEEAASSDAQAVLAAGIQDISNSLVDDFSLNDVLRIVLETMYRAVGFRRVLLAVRDPKTNTLQGRIGFGPEVEDLCRRFRLPLAGENGKDVFSLALARSIDMLISDASDGVIASRIPEWYRKAGVAPTFILFPLVLRNTPVALIYAEGEKAGDIVISEKELSLLRTLRNQAVLAIKQSR